MSTIGHNSGTIEAGHLMAFIERIERLEEDRKTVSDEIKDVQDKVQ